MKSLETILRCECGFEARAENTDALVTEVQRHAWKAHGMALSPDEARSLAQLSRKLERSPALLDHVRGREQGRKS